MFNWLRGKVSGESGASGIQYDSLSRDEGEGKNTLVVVREGAVPQMTLESNELQLLRDIPEFKPLVSEGGTHAPNKLDVKALLAICKIYQQHLQSSAESVASEQQHVTAQMKETDLAVKVLMERLSERQKAYAKAAEQLKKTSDITQSLKKMRNNMRETEEMLRQLNDHLPEQLRLVPFNCTHTVHSPT